MVRLWQHLNTSCLCWFAGCLPCLWRWSRPEPARNWSQVKAEAATCSDWPSAAKFCHSLSHTCCTHPEFWRSVNIIIIIICIRFFYHVDSESWLCSFTHLNYIYFQWYSPAVSVLRNEEFVGKAFISLILPFPIHVIQRPNLSSSVPVFQSLSCHYCSSFLTWSTVWT